MTFFDKYTYRQKKYAMFILLVLLLAVSYKRSFRTTLDRLEEIEEIEQKQEEAKYAVQSIQVTQKSIQELNKIIGEENVTVEKVQQGFLSFFTKKSTRMEVYQVDEVLRYKHPDYSILTHQVVLKGNFLHSLSFIYQLEKEFRLAKLINVTFVSEKKNNDEIEQLYTVLLVQNYER
jgi:hypothetical protein